MTEVLLLEGPDGNRYRAVLEHTDLWITRPFAQFNSSEWWKSQCPRYPYWGCWRVEYTLNEIKSIFKIVAETTTQLPPTPNIIIHYD